MEERPEILEGRLLDEAGAVLAEAGEQFDDVALLDLLIGELGQRGQNVDAGFSDTPDLIVGELLEHGEDDANEEVVADDLTDAGQSQHQLAADLDAAVVLHRHELRDDTLSQHRLPETLA